MRSFVGVTGHFMLDYTLESVMLCCIRFFGSHTGEAIQSSYQDIVSDFEISLIALPISQNIITFWNAFLRQIFINFK